MNRMHTVVWGIFRRHNAAGCKHRRKRLTNHAS